MGSDYNTQRGKILFESKLQLDKLSHFPELAKPELKAKLESLRNYFADQVGVMPVEGALSASRMADACVKATLYSGDEDFMALAMAALGFYNQLSPGGMPAATFDQDAFDKNQEITSMLQKEMEDNTVKRTDDNIATVFVVENGKVVEKELVMDSLDMIDDMEYEDLSTEGKRSVGIIKSSFDTMSGEEAEETIDSRALPEGEIRVNPDGSWEILSPYTGGTDVYPISDNIYGCFETDKKFRVVLNLGDLHSNNSPAPKPPVQKAKLIIPPSMGFKRKT